MTADETIRRAKLILKDLNDLGLRSSGGMLEEWMAHYVAEAISRLEQGATDSTLSDQCAATITSLWELRDAQKQRELTSGVNGYLRRSTHLNESAAKRLRDAIGLAGAESANAPPFDAESGVTLSQLGKLEEHALSVLWAATYHAQRSTHKNARSETPNEGQGPERVDLFEVLEKPRLNLAQDQLQKVFPEFKELTIDDYQLVSGRIREVLRAFERVRHRLLEATLAAEPAQVPEVAILSADLTSEDDILGLDDEPKGADERTETRDVDET